jgi:hypothetical protein
MVPKRVAIVQSSYIPWKGYFDLIRAVDEFILLDDVQFTRRDWRSRNRIKTRHGSTWLTVPVRSRGRYLQPINEVTVSDTAWGLRHWKILQASYGRTRFFADYTRVFEPLYREPVSDRLSLVNHSFIAAVCQVLGIQTRITWSTDYHPRQGRTERLVDLCAQAGATEYLSGPSARDYLDLEAFAGAGLTVHFADYSGYRPYEQPYPPFDHAVTILDLLFCTGPAAIDYLKSPCPASSAA